MALASPWGTWYMCPSWCAMLWHTPRKALANAMPARVEALCRLERAGTLAGSLNAVGRFSKISFDACSSGRNRREGSRERQETGR
eukprot:963261-Pyramimonas_sp.AAC.1